MLQLGIFYICFFLISLNITTNIININIIITKLTAIGNKIGVPKIFIVVKSLNRILVLRLTLGAKFIANKNFSEKNVIGKIEVKICGMPIINNVKAIDCKKFLEINEINKINVDNVIPIKICNKIDMVIYCPIVKG